MNTLETLLREISPEQINNTLFVIMGLAVSLGLLLRLTGRQQAFVNYVPTLLTTLGIFGTFFGIVLGLLDFDPLDIQGSIPPLLEGLKTAFITSLAGIFSSLLFKTLTTFSFISARGNQSEQATPNAILHALENQLGELRQLHIAQEGQQQALLSLKSALVGNEESTLFGQIKLLRTDINDHVKQKNQQDLLVETARQTAFTEFSTQLWQQLQEVSQTLSKSATEQVIEALKNVISDFNHNLTEQFGENFKQLNVAVAKLVEWQQNYKEQLAHMQLQYEQGVQSISATEVAVSQISEQSKSIPVSMDALKTVMEVNQHQLAELERHLEAFTLMRDEAIKAVPEIQQQVQQTLDNVTAAANTASEHYKTLLVESDSYIRTHIKTSHELLEKFSYETEKGITSVGQQLIDSSGKMSKELELASNEFTDNTARTNESLQTSSDYLQNQSEIIKQHLQDAVSDLNNHLRDMISNLVSEGSTMSQTMQQANQLLIADTENMRNNVVDATEKMQQRLSDVIDDSASKQIQQAQRTFDAMEDQIREKVGLTSDAVEKQLHLIDQSMQTEIERVIQQMGAALAQVTGRFVTDYSQLTQAMHDIVKRNAA